MLAWVSLHWTTVMFWWTIFGAFFFGFVFGSEPKKESRLNELCLFVVVWPLVMVVALGGIVSELVTGE